MLILLRHGRTKANAGGLLQGRIDLELDDLGEMQAQAAAAAIGPVDRVIASPLVRAQQTAAAFGQSVETDDRFIELDYGDWEAKPVKDVSCTDMGRVAQRSRLPSTKRRNAQRTWPPGQGWAHGPGGRRGAPEHRGSEPCVADQSVGGVGARHTRRHDMASVL